MPDGVTGGMRERHAGSAKEGEQRMMEQKGDEGDTREENGSAYVNVKK